MQLSRQLWVVLTVACALILLASNAINSRPGSGASSDKARLTYSSRRDLRVGVGNLQEPLPASSLLAFVGVFTATKPERRQAVRATWFPASEAGLARLASAVTVLYITVIEALSSSEAAPSMLPAGWRRKPRSECASL